jgi:PIN domain nuclease of toxin-antitoxin system
VTLLLDTHVLLWWLADDPRLTPGMRGAIEDPATTVALSAVSTWEIAIKMALGKMDAPDDLAVLIRGAGFDELAVTVDDGWAAGRLPRHHDDPFDRMLIAQAVRRGLVVATADRRFAAYDVHTLT